ncbi:DUF624 domain-containing protein [Micromonospora sp. NBC_01796]|uniref:DUF624 domain-containing protein n=1 Tax=Micromonospora sp. NBC_01796 TaxID=2975987 RepID=UPI002DD902C9|nr:DUF624 domain-containing protein [Micromonospora sp. NBC_01796]WSA88922.1 hypothetical protein OIE47_15650 [Micromonospora sp. NBC_01796]
MTGVAGRGAGWPEEPGGSVARRPDWRDTLRNASDLALVGILTTVAALPVLTAGAAVATASAAVHHWSENESWPGFRTVVRGFVRALLPGALATLIAAGVAALFTVNLLALGRGVVPGGPALIVVTVLLAGAVTGFAGLTVVQLGRQDAQGWREAVRQAGRTAVTRPVVPIALTGVLGLVAVLCGLILPLITPILAGYTLLALHATVRRIERSSPNR